MKSLNIKLLFLEIFLCTALYAQVTPQIPQPVVADPTGQQCHVSSSTALKQFGGTVYSCQGTMGTTGAYAILPGAGGGGGSLTPAGIGVGGATSANTLKGPANVLVVLDGSGNGAALPTISGDGTLNLGTGALSISKIGGVPPGTLFPLSATNTPLLGNPTIGGNKISGVRVATLPVSCVAGTDGAVTFASGSPLVDAQYTCDGSGHYALPPGGSVTALVGGAQGSAGSNTLRDFKSVADFASLPAAITSISTTLTTLTVPAATTISSNLTIPANVTLSPQTGGIINCTGTPTITINGPIVAGDYQIFGSGCLVNLATNNYLQNPSGIWWGMKGDASTDNSVPMAAATTALFITAHAQSMTLPCGTYNISTPQTIYPGNSVFGVDLEGATKGCTVLKLTGSQTASPTLTIAYDAAGSQPLYNVHLANMTILSGGLSPYSVYFKNIYSQTLLDNVAGGQTDETASVSACFVLYNTTASVINTPDCSKSASFSWGTHIPKYGIIADGLTAFVGTTVTIINNPTISGVSVAGIWLHNGNSMVINQMQSSANAKSLIVDSGWTGLIANAGDWGENDTNTTEDMTLAGSELTFNGVQFNSAFPIHVTGGKTKAFNYSTFGDLSTPLIIDSSSTHTTVNGSEVSGTIQDGGYDTSYSNLYNISNAQLVVNQPGNKLRLGLGGNGAGTIINSTALWSGTWYASNAAVKLIDTAPFTGGSKWRAIFIGSFTANSVNESPDSNSVPYLDRNNATNTFTFSDGTIWVFSIDAATGQFEVTSSTSTVHGFTGSIWFFPSAFNSISSNSIDVAGGITSGGAGLFSQAGAANERLTIRTTQSGFVPSICLQQSVGGACAIIQSGGNANDIEVFTSGTGSGTARVIVPANGAAATWSIPQIGPLFTGPIAGSETIASSATPTFTTATRYSINTLTANVTSFTLPAGADGQQKVLAFCQNGTGNFTVAPPSNVHAFFTVGTIASKCSTQTFTYSVGQTAWLAESVGVINQ